MATYTQKPGKLDIKITRHDDMTMPVVLGFNITGYTLVAKFVTIAGADLVTATITTVTAATGSITISLTDTQVDALPDTCKWYLMLTTGTTDRSYLAGFVTVGEPQDV